MSNKLVITVDGNSSGLQKALKSAETRLTTFNTKVTASSRGLNSFMKQMTNARTSVASLNTSINQIAAANVKLAAAIAASSASLNGFTQRANSAGRAARTASTNMRGMGIGVNDIIMGMTSLNTLIYTTIFLFGGITKATIDAGARMERLTALMNGLSTAADQSGKLAEGKTAIDYIYKMATKTPFSLENLSNVYTKLQSGFSDQSKTIKGMDTLTDAVARFGGTGEQLERSAVAIQQMSGKGVVSMEELRQQLGEHVPDAAQLMARGLGLSMAEMTKIISEGKVKAGPALNALFDEWERKSKGAALAMMDTYNGLWAQLSTGFEKFVLKVSGFDNNGVAGKGGFFDALKTQMIQLTEFFQSRDGVIFAQEVGASMKTLLEIFVYVIQTLVKYKEEIILAGKAFAIYFTVSKTVGILKTIGGALETLGLNSRNAWTALKGLGGGLSSAGSLAVGATQSVGGLYAAVSSLRAGVASAGAAFIASNLALGVIVAGAIVAIGVVYKLATAFNAAADAAATLAGNRRAAERGQVLDEKTLNTTRSIINAKKDKLKVEQQSIIAIENQARAEGTLGKLRADKNFQARKAAYFKSVGEVNNDIKSFNVNRTTANKIDEDAVNNNFKAKIERDVASRLRVIQDGREKYNKGIDKIRERDGATQSAATKKLADKMQKDADDKQNIAEAKIYDDKARLLRINAQNFRGAQRQVALDMASDYEKQARTLKDAVANNMNGVISPSEYLMNGGKDDKKKTAKPKADPLGSLDVNRSSLETKLMKIKELEYALKGKTQEFTDQRAEIEESVRGDVMKIKSQDELNKRTIQASEDIGKLTAKLKVYNETAKERTKQEEALRSLQQESNDQSLQTLDALGALDDAYNGVSNQVERYNQKLRAKYREELNSKLEDSEGRSIAAQTEIAIAESVSNRRKELLAEEARKAGDNTREITDSFLTQNQLAEANYQREVARIEGLIAEAGKLYGPEGEQIVGHYYAYLEALQKQRARNNPLAKWAEENRQMGISLRDASTGWMDQFLNGLASGKLAFKDFAISILNDIGKIIIKAMIARAIMAAINGSGGGFAGSVRAGANSSLNSLGTTMPDPFAFSGSFDFPTQMSSTIAGVNHAGGKIGNMSPGRRSVDASLFNFAQRYHTGGIIGLGPNEEPIIAEKGEKIYKEQDWKALERGQGGGMAPPVINIINQTGNKVESEQAQPRMDGEKMIVDIVLKNASKPGPMRDMLKGLK